MAFLKHQQRILNLIGYDLQPRESRLRRLFIAVNLLLLYTIIWPEMAYVIDNLDNIRNATDGLCPLLFGLSSAARLMTLRLRRNRFGVLFTRLHSLWRNASDSEACSLLQKAFEKENRLSFPYILSTSLVGVLYLAFPVCRAFYQQSVGHEDSNVSWEMPMRSMYVRCI